MENIPAYLTLFTSDPYAWTLSVFVPVVTVLVSVRPIMSWPVNTTKFLELAEEQLRAGEEERLMKLAQVVPNAHIPKLVAAWLEGGREEFQTYHQLLASQRRRQLITLGFAGFLVLGSAVIAGMTYEFGITDFRLIASAGISVLIYSFAFYSLLQIGTDCRKLAEEGLDRLASARSHGESTESW